MDKRPIGIFDSGVGGLTVVKEVTKLLPNEQIIYFGDTARVPYGGKSKETITEFSIEIVEFLLKKNVKAVIIACNSVSSNSYEELTKRFDIPIIEVITPGVKASLEATKNNIVGVIGTQRTIESCAYETKLKEQRKNIIIYSKPCPLLVPLAEEGWVRNNVAKLTIEIYLEELLSKNIDTLLLGCTHYPLLEECIKEAVLDVTVVNPAIYTAIHTKEYLQSLNLLNEEISQKQPIFYVTDETSKFNRICKETLGKEYIGNKVSL